ncbi:inorganic triphosphatase [Morganella morganii]|uniref:Inorganic triphosphatase n=2 Tax=Morganella morganii TaxID=582 RepID=A0A8I0Q0L3_MORMO|nr:inorganic triphosphatase [Morganella morganii]
MSMSDYETELKFAVKPEAITAVIAALTTFPHQHFRAVRLTNSYFETADDTLRQWDMGLRIRGCDTEYEMTLKTAGNDIGGLHQRPEYNIPLSRPELDLAALPADVWPPETDVAALQSSLRARFTTDFAREKWLLTVNHSVVEAVLDQGSVVAGEAECPICEFEMELKEGTAADLLTAAKALAELPGLRLAGRSKAARGYWLAQGAPVPELPELFTAWDPQTPLTDVVVRLIKQWQSLEEAWLLDADGALPALQQTLSLLLTLADRYPGAVPDFVRDCPLPEVASALAEADAKSADVCFSPVWLQCKLAFTQWVFALWMAAPAMP